MNAEIKTIIRVYQRQSASHKTDFRYMKFKFDPNQEYQLEAIALDDAAAAANLALQCKLKTI